MPRTVIDYDNTIIYKIQHIDDNTLLYVGHTTDFTKRKSAHKANLNNTNNKAFNYKVYQMIRDNGGWDMFHMIAIKTFACSNKREAEAEEDRVMRELKVTMNNNRALLTEQDKKDDKKSYREEHASEIREYRKKYDEEHASEIREYRKKYDEEHAIEISEYSKKYKEEHSERVKAQAKKYRDTKKAEFEANFSMEKYSEHLKKQKKYREAYKERQNNRAV